MTYKITALPGDGIGPEILKGSIEILETLSKKFQFEYDLVTKDFGGIAIDKHGEPLPPDTLEACRNSDAILLGAVGGPKWTDPKNRPEHGLLGIRKALNLFSNIRPTIVTESTAHLSPLKESIVKDTDFIIVRELTGGLYFGEPKYFNEDQAVDTLTYTTDEITRIAHIAFKLASKRNKVVTSVDKENVLSSSKLWRQTLEQVSKEYPDVTLNHLLVDACSMHLITNPKQFDVIVTENLFGDILSDEASVIPGS
ncbi:MAG: 3-isopropylmalate dehydrogenase, partial [Mammaliicoccus vitulinus]